jgi:hypothetical protein
MNDAVPSIAVLVAAMTGKWSLLGCPRVTGSLILAGHLGWQLHPAWLVSLPS